MYELSEKNCNYEFHVSSAVCKHNIYKIKAQLMTEDMDMGFYDVKD